MGTSHPTAACPAFGGKNGHHYECQVSAKTQPPSTATSSGSAYWHHGHGPNEPPTLAVHRRSLLSITCFYASSLFHTSRSTTSTLPTSATVFIDPPAFIPAKYMETTLEHVTKAENVGEGTSLLLAIPVEIRYQIYYHLFDSSKIDIVPCVGNPYLVSFKYAESHHQILFTCHQLRSEALKFYLAAVRVSVLGPSSWHYVRYHFTGSGSCRPWFTGAEHIIDKSSRPQFEKDGKVVRDIFPRCRVLEYWGHYEAQSRDFAEHPMAWWMLDSPEELREIESGRKDQYFISGGEEGGGRTHAEQQRWLQAFSWYWGRGRPGISGTVNERPVREVSNSRYCVWATELILYHPDFAVERNGFPKGLAGYRFTYNVDTGEVVRRARLLASSGLRSIEIPLNS